MALRLKLLASELLLFSSVQLLALFVGFKLIKFEIAQFGAVQFQPVGESIISFLVAFAIATALILIFIKFIKLKFAYSALFAFMIFIGAGVVFSVFMPDLLAVGLAVALVAFRFFLPNVFTHNLAFFLAIAGVSAQLGTLIPVVAVIVLLVVLSVYDYVAVFKTTHMVTMFKEMSAKGALMGIIIPENLSGLSVPAHEVVKSKLEKRKSAKASPYVVLGGGDLAFPAVFAISALAQYGLVQALGVLFGSLAGILIIHYLFLRKAMALPALPPIAACSIIGFLISLFL